MQTISLRASRVKRGNLRGGAGLKNVRIFFGRLSTRRNRSNPDNLTQKYFRLEEELRENTPAGAVVHFRGPHSAGALEIEIESSALAAEAVVEIIDRERSAACEVEVDSLENRDFLTGGFIQDNPGREIFQIEAFLRSALRGIEN